MKRSIEFHKKCLENSRIYLESEAEEMKRIITRYSEMQRNHEFSEFQLNCAISEGKDGFDSERYKKRK